MSDIILNHTVTMDDLSAEEEFVTAADFEDATRTVVRTLGRNFDCDIIFAGQGAKTNGNVVVLPAQDPTKLMTKKQYAVGQGFANHETMHNLCTDMPLVETEMKRLKGQGKKLAMACAQAIEDVRIESAAKSLYPGIPSQISSTADYVAKKFLEEYLAKDPEIVKDFKRVGPIAITWRGRQRLGYDAPYVDKALASLSPEMLDQLDKWCDVIDTLPTGATGPGEFDQASSHKGTAKAFQIAELIAKEIDDIEQDDDDEDDDGSGSGDGDEAGDNSQRNTNDQAQGPGKGGGGGSNKPTQGNDPQPDDTPIDPDMQAAVQALLQQNDKGGWRPVSTALDTWTTKDYDCSDRPLSDPNNRLRYAHSLSELGGRTAVMKRKFERALLTAAEAEYVTGQRAGRLDVKRQAVNIMKGRENVFRKKMDGKAFDSAVTILVDASGSMSGQRMQLANQVCIALAECVERTSVALEVLAFTACYDDDDHAPGVVAQYNAITNEVYQNKDKPWTRIFHRCEPVQMFELKSFDESLREARQSLGGMMRLPRGNTPDGDAILKAASRLKKQKKTKHIMLVLTDGQSGYGAIYGNCTDYTQGAINYCTKDLGIHMIGIGMMTDHVRHLYKNYAVVNDLNDLDKAVIDKLARMVIGENFKVDNADVGGAKANYDKRGRAA